ncbi:MAG TPA: hypothetical protein VGE93_20505 [Bryobacteraceae bacterium]
MARTLGDCAHFPHGLRIGIQDKLISLCTADKSLGGVAASVLTNRSQLSALQMKAVRGADRINLAEAYPGSLATTFGIVFLDFDSRNYFALAAVLVADQTGFQNCSTRASAPPALGVCREGLHNA